MQKGWTELQQSEREWMLDKLKDQEHTIAVLVRWMELILERADAQEGERFDRLAVRIDDVRHIATFALKQVHDKEAE